MKGILYLVSIIILLSAILWHISFLYSINSNIPKILGETININDSNMEIKNYFQEMEELLKFFPFVRLKDYKTIEFAVPYKIKIEDELVLPEYFEVIDPKTGESVNIYWSKPTILPDGYELCKKQEEDQTFLCSKFSNTKTEYIDKDIQTGKKYYYKLKVFKYDKNCSALNTSESNKKCEIDKYLETEIKQIGPVQDITPPSPPIDPKVELKKDESGKYYVLISFIPSPSKDLEITKIYKSTRYGDIGVPFKEIKVSELPEVKDYSVEQGKTYYYTFVSIDARGNKSLRKIISTPGNLEPFKSLELKGFIRIKEEKENEMEFGLGF